MNSMHPAVAQAVSAAQTPHLLQISGTILKSAAEWLTWCRRVLPNQVQLKGYLRTQWLRRERWAATSDSALEIYMQDPALAQNQQPRSMLKAALHSDQ